MLIRDLLTRFGYVQRTPYLDKERIICLNYATTNVMKFPICKSDPNLHRVHMHGTGRCAVPSERTDAGMTAGTISLKHFVPAGIVRKEAAGPACPCAGEFCSVSI